jgi:CPA2 family monovalent cation:H+ antiporter-2
MEAVRAMLPGLGDFEPIRVGTGSFGDGKTLGDLDLRGRTGATVVGLVRGNERVPAPEADTRLAAGDWIAVTGTHQAITEARDLVGGGVAGGAAAGRPTPWRERPAE